MNNRLLETIRYKTGGKQTEFASIMGWTPQYLAKLLKGDNFGIRPVLAVIEKLPEINARWFLTGEGEMIEQPKYANLRKTMFENMLAVLDVEKYMPVMTSAELHDFEQVITGNKKPDFSPILIEKWQGLLDNRDDDTNAKFTAAFNESDRKLCKHPTAK